MMFASIPSPSSGTISIGPLDLTAYGLCIALGVIVGVWLAGRRFEEKGIGTRDDMSSIAVGAVLAGVVGARLYHVATDWEKFEDNLGDIPKIWEGGLGIPGGILLGTLVGVWLVTRRGIPAGLAANAAAPAIALAQAIGRWGNYFNQELYGKPTARPWALEIDPENFPATPSYLPGTTFHPTFLYESIWNLLLGGALLLIDRKFKVRPWQLFAMYVVGYGAGRFFIEGLRIDEAKEFGGLRLEPVDVDRHRRRRPRLPRLVDASPRPRTGGGRGPRTRRYGLRHRHRHSHRAASHRRRRAGDDGQRRAGSGRRRRPQRRAAGHR
ncbi:MAG: prolipoprotein diacylglyceryl transferase [Ilumatobacteraceae bacterium]